MQILSQLDPLWADVKLGDTNRTIAQVGCTTICLSETTDYFGIYSDPKTCARKLLYDSNAMVIWSSLKNIGLSLVSRVRAYNQQAIDQAIKDPNTTCLLNVDKGGHWVLALSRVPFTSTYWVADPYEGRRRLYSGVVGYAVIKKV